MYFVDDDAIYNVLMQNEVMFKDIKSAGICLLNY